MTQIVHIDIIDSQKKWQKCMHMVASTTWMQKSTFLNNGSGLMMNAYACRCARDRFPPFWFGSIYMISISLPWQYTVTSGISIHWSWSRDQYQTVDSMAKVCYTHIYRMNSSADELELEAPALEPGPGFARGATATSLRALTIDLEAS